MVRHVKIFYVLITMFFIGSPLDSKEIKSPEYIKYVDEIVCNFVKDMEEKHELHCYGSGGSMPTNVKQIELLFISYQKSSIEDARKTEVAIVQELLKRINNHKEIRPYLSEYPFNTNNVSVSISFRTKTDDYPLDGSIASVFLAKNKIFYKAAETKMSAPIRLNHINKNNEWTTEVKPGELKETLTSLLEETYEEALKIAGIAPPTLSQKWYGKPESCHPFLLRGAISRASSIFEPR